MQTGGTPSPISNASHFERYLQYAEGIITSYKGNEPLHLFLKKYFSSNKKHGSRDRKIITSLCFDYFRLGHGVSHHTGLRERLVLSTFLCETKPPLLPGTFGFLKNTSTQSSLLEKLILAEKEFDTGKIFLFPEELSDQVNREQFSLSFLVQPKLFIRVRRGFTHVVLSKLRSAGFRFEELDKECLAFANNEKVSSVIEVDKEAVIQDYNSQKTIDLLQQEMKSRQPGLSIWDCCAGSGGKSILAYDIFPNVRLTVSDKRSYILENLKLRFDKAGITDYETVLIDLQFPSLVTSLIHGPFNVIIADVPCTGSGTWSRTPEQLTFFHKKDIDAYAMLQRKIIENAIPYLEEKGYLLYITCSVFKKENEENVAFIQQKFELILLGTEYLKGYQMQADTMFVALFKK